MMKDYSVSELSVMAVIIMIAAMPYLLILSGVCIIDPALMDGSLLTATHSDH